LAAAAGLFVFSLLAGAWAIAWFSIYPPRFKQRGTPADFGASFQSVEFRSEDGTPLSGWYIPRDQAKAVLVLAHGMTAERSQMIPWAEFLWKDGYSLLLFDFRAMGKSGGKICTMGLREPDDVLAAVDFVSSLPENSDLPVGLFGFSMGGISSIYAASRNEEIAAVVSHGAFATLDRAISQRCRKHFGPMAPIVEKWARTLGQRWYPANSSEVSPISVVGNIAPRPILLVNGALDNIVVVKNAEDMAALTSSSKLWILPNSGHAFPKRIDLEDYRNGILSFLDEAFCRD